MRLRALFAPTALVVGLALGVAACDFGFRLSGEPTVAKVRPTPSASASAVPTLVAVADPLGERPELDEPKAFKPPTMSVFQGPQGLTVWHLERPELPIATAAFISPYGAAIDPADKPGTMSFLADMLDEGAGKRSALEISESFATLGASFFASATLDGSSASVTALRTKFDAAFEILCDVVARPKLQAADFDRAKKLWMNNLKKRADEPMAVASTVLARQMYGEASPYGHPSIGLQSKSAAVDLATLKSLHQATWRPDRLTLVVVGQVTRADLEKSLAQNLGTWKPQGEAAKPAPVAAVKETRPRALLVHRPDAVQTVVLVSGPGVSASGSDSAPLGLINDAIGGSFTSRLNMKLREETNWTYGVGSAFTFVKGQGTFNVRSSVEAKFTGPALAEILRTLDDIHSNGLLPDEIGKTKAQDQRDMMQMFEGSTSIADRMRELAGLGLPSGYDASATKLRQAADESALKSLAKSHLDTSRMTIVLVGDKDVIKASLAPEDLKLEFLLVDAEGYTEAERPAKAEPKPPAAKPKAPTKPATTKPAITKPATVKPPTKPAKPAPLKPATKPK